MSLYTILVDQLFADPNIMREATHRQGGVGDGTALKIRFKAPDERLAAGAFEAVVGTVLIDVRVSECPTLARHDTFTLSDDSVYKVIGDPRRDSERLIWRAEAKEL